MHTDLASSHVNHQFGRFEARPKANSGSWGVYDTKRKCFVLQSVSPQAKYNKEFAVGAAICMNAMADCFTE